MKVVNLTPHPITVGGVVFPPEGAAPRVAVEERPVEPIMLDDGTAVPMVETTMGAVVGLPEPEPGVLLVVSLAVAQAARRDDLVVPHGLVRDEAGRVIGAAALARVMATCSPSPRPHASA